MSFEPRDYVRHILDEADSLPPRNPLRLKPFRVANEAK